MPYVVSSDCSPSDFEGMADAMFDAMGGLNPFVNACYPHNMDRAYRDKYSSLFASLARHDPCVRWAKVTETESLEIVGAALFLVYDGATAAAKHENGHSSGADHNEVSGKPEPNLNLDRPDGYYDSPAEKEYADALLTSRNEHRQNLLREIDGPFVIWSIVTVTPSHQNRGVGTLLAQWGVEITDRIGAESVLESTAAGRRLYEKHGFDVRSHVALEVPDKFADRPMEHLFIMHRPAASSSR